MGKRRGEIQIQRKNEIKEKLNLPKGLLREQKMKWLLEPFGVLIDKHKLLQQKDDTWQSQDQKEN